MVVHVKALPTVAAAQLGAVVATAEPPTVTLVEAEAEDTLLVSLATTLIVLLPFDEQVTEILLVVDVPVHPAASVHVNV